MTYTLDTNITELPLVGPQLTKAFSILEIETVADLLYNFPTRYMDFRKKVNIAQAEENDIVTIVARVKSVRANMGFRGRMSYAEATLEDGTGTIKAVWFNQSYIAKQINVGDELIVSGKVGRYKALQLTNPVYEKLREDEDGNPINLHTGRLVPVYRRADLVPLRTMRRLIKSVLSTASELEDFVGVELAQSEGLMPIAEAVRLLHFPETEEQISESRFRIAVDDVLPQQLAAQMRKAEWMKTKGHKVVVDIEKVKSFLKTLPFELTASQKRAAWDVFQDLETGRPMNRLLQGDVGSGKTIVAILAALQTAGAGLQCVVLAPTEILAKQHYDTFGDILGTKSGVALLTRTFAESGDSSNASDANDGFGRDAILNKLADGEIKIAIGTHALLQENINFKKLGLVIVDEQHRFGVDQRSLLLHGAGITPHMLGMSATPIPRTLAQSLYADLNVSVLKQVPTGRKPVQTEVVPESEREKAYDFVRREAGEGRQAFVVTPRVEESTKTTSLSEVRSVKKEFARLQTEIFPDLKLGLLYGKMKAAEKDQVMADFASGKLNVLVSTSVIEIGIDIPNATSMIIEGSERFGLAQLHQLRGRIGRNSFDCKCFLFTTEPNHQDLKRLRALSKTTDGFVLAQLDLEERGFGDLFGKQQSGFLFRFPQFISIKALISARDIAEKIIQKDKKLINISTKLFKLTNEYLESISY